MAFPEQCTICMYIYIHVLLTRANTSVYKRVGAEEASSPGSWPEADRPVATRRRKPGSQRVKAAIIYDPFRVSDLSSSIHTGRRPRTTGICSAKRIRTALRVYFFFLLSVDFILLFVLFDARQRTLVIYVAQNKRNRKLSAFNRSA